MKALEEVYNEYLPRFDNLLWDTKFIALAIMKLDVKQFFGAIEDEGVRRGFFRSNRTTYPG